MLFLYPHLLIVICFLEVLLAAFPAKGAPSFPLVAASVMQKKMEDAETAFAATAQEVIRPATRVQTISSNISKRCDGRSCWRWRCCRSIGAAPGKQPKHRKHQKSYTGACCGASISSGQIRRERQGYILAVAAAVSSLGISSGERRVVCLSAPMK